MKENFIRTATIPLEEYLELKQVVKNNKNDLCDKIVDECNKLICTLMFNRKKDSYKFIILERKLKKLITEYQNGE